MLNDESLAIEEFYSQTGEIVCLEKIGRLVGRKNESPMRSFYVIIIFSF
jgi:hypothetical protein